MKHRGQFYVLAFMVALWTACLLMPLGQDTARLEPYPDEILEVLSHSGIDVEGTRAAWTGRLSSNGLTVAYTIEAQNGRARAIDLSSRYSFPVRVSSRGLQDWATATRTGIEVQSYLDGSVYLSERVPVVEPVTQHGLFATVENGMSAFEHFKSSFVQPLGGQQVLNEPTIFPPKPSGRMVVDYVSAQDVKYLAKLWGWSYEEPFGAPISPTWAVPVKIDGKLWSIFGPGFSSLEPASFAGFTISGEFQARTRHEQDQFRKLSKRLKHDLVAFSPDSADVQVSTMIDLKGGVTISALKKRILDFVHRAQKLPAADDSVFG